MSKRRKLVKTAPPKPPKRKTVAQLNAEITALHAEIARLEGQIYSGHYEARVTLDRFVRDVGPLLTTIQNKLDRLLPGPWPLVSKHKQDR